MYLTDIMSTPNNIENVPFHKDWPVVVGDSLVVYNGDKQAITYVAKTDSVKKTKKHLRSKSKSVLSDHSDSASVVQLTWTKRIKIKKLNVMVRGSDKGRFPKDTVMTNNSKQTVSLSM